MPGRITRVEADRYLKGLLNDGFTVVLFGADPGENPRHASRVNFGTFGVSSRNAICINGEIRLVANTPMSTAFVQLVDVEDGAVSKIEVATHFGLLRDVRHMIASGHLQQPLRVARRTPVWLKTGTTIFSMREWR